MAVFGRQMTIQMDSGGEWGDDLRAAFCAERNIHLQFQGKGAHPWILERRNGFTRGSYTRLAADGRSPSLAILNEIQFGLTAVRVPRLIGWFWGSI